MSVEFSVYQVAKALGMSMQEVGYFDMVELERVLSFERILPMAQAEYDYVHGK